MTDEQYREAARKQYGKDGQLEIDGDAEVSRGDDPGAYVQAWVWVENDEQLEDHEVLELPEAYYDFVFEYPNAGPRPDVLGMKQQVYGMDATCVMCGDYLYNVSADVYQAVDRFLKGEGTLPYDKTNENRQP